MINIYKITNIKNNKVYIGQTSKGYLVRFAVHKRKLNKNKHRNLHLQSSWNKYGENAFTLQLLEEVMDPIVADSRERYYINLYSSDDAANGYNNESGGIINKSHSNATKELISQKVKAKYDSGELVTWNKGKHWDSNTKKRLGSSGPRHSEEFKERQRQRMLGPDHPWRGKKHTEEAKNTMRAKKLGKKPVNLKAVLCVETGIVYESAHEAARKIGNNCSNTNISAVCRGKGKTCGGYKWAFVLPITKTIPVLGLQLQKSPKPKSRKPKPHAPGLPIHGIPTTHSLPMNYIKPTVYLLAGQSGAGKTWVANQLKDKFSVYSNDYDGPTKAIEEMMKDSTKTYIYETPVFAPTFINKNSDKFDIKLVVISEHEDVINIRLSSRSSSAKASTGRRFKRFASLANRYNAIFTGTSQECLDFLKKV